MSISRVVFLGGFFPDSKRREIEVNSKGVIQYAADVLQQALVKGMLVNSNNVVIVNSVYIGSYPKRYKKSKICSYSFLINENIEGFNVGFLNLPLYKFYSRYINVKKYLTKIIKKNDVIIIYAIHTSFLKAAVDLKSTYPSLKICLIVPDLPSFMGGSNNFFERILKKVQENIQKKLLNEVDTFVLLSDHMHRPLKVNNRPWVRIEGVFNNEDLIIEQKKEKLKTILYSGTLAKRYGIMNLLEAFSMIADENYRLWICGDGDTKRELEKISTTDKRICYFGQVEREQVLKLQKRATVLVNPRDSKGEFTKYSFPSKTMEYLASGTPSIIYKLEGIPEEYFNYCFVVENETPFSLSQTITLVCEKTEEELKEYGDKAKQFILTNKTAEKQAKKIYNMLNKL